MKKENFNKIMKTLDYMPNGIKEACVIIDEYLKNCQITDNSGLISPKSAVSTDSFIRAVEKVMAYAWKENKDNDCIPEMFECDYDCYLKKTAIFCPGECQIAHNENKNLKLIKCPYKI